MNIASSQHEPFQLLTTERLIIRRFTEHDLESLFALRNDPALQRFQSWDAMDKAAIGQFIADVAAAEPGVPGQWFQFAIVLRTSGQLIGDCGLHLLAEDPRQGEIGYTLSSAFQGKGLAQEAISAILTYIFQQHNVHRIAAITDVRNTGSIKLLERLNFRREGRTGQAFWNKGEWVDEYLYAMTAARWKTLAENRVRSRTKQTATTSIVLLGTGTPNPDPQRHGSAVAVVVQAKTKEQEEEKGKRHLEQAYLVDAGPGVVRRAADAAERGVRALAMPGLTRLFLTHLHSDHTAGLPDLILTPWVLGRNEPLVIYGPKGTGALVHHLLAAYGEDIRERREGLEPSNDQGYRVQVHEYEEGLIYQDPLVQVEAFSVQHGSWPAFGLRFTTADRTVVISGDTRPFEGLANHYQKCDLLIHEVYSADGFQHRPAAWQQYHAAVHTSTTELAALANAARPGLLVLIHQLFWGVSEEALLAEIRATYDGPVISGQDLDQF